MCETYGFAPSKRYGQNYLTSAHVIELMLEAGNVSSQDTVVEIGPGFGVLTLALAAKAKKVVAFEIEKKLQPYWEEKQQEYPNLEIVWGNALTQISDNRYQITPKYKVLANLPYQITSNALRVLLEAENKPETIVVMVQKEVAERICSKPGQMSLLSVSVQYFGTPRIVTKVPKGNFWPQPKVDSAVVAIDNIMQKQDTELFFRVARAGFANKRKQLWRNVSEGLSLEKAYVQDVLESTVGSKTVRAQELSIAEWEKIVNTLRARLL